MTTESNKYSDIFHTIIQQLILDLSFSTGKLTEKRQKHN